MTSTTHLTPLAQLETVDREAFDEVYDSDAGPVGCQALAAALLGAPGLARGILRDGAQGRGTYRAEWPNLMPAAKAAAAERALNRAC